VRDYVFVNLWWGIGTVAANGFALVYVYRKYRFSLEGPKASRGEIAS
jgi:hypothetical protein